MFYLVVSLSGAAVMVIELLGTRLIAPFYGSSLYVWTSLIAVTMMALAIGYYLGGRLSDRANDWYLPSLVVLSGVLCAWLPEASPHVLALTNGLGIRWGALSSAMVLFFPVLVLLGAVGPLVIGQMTDRLASVGSSAGRVYALTTIGGVVGTLFLCFYLFPKYSSREILQGLGMLLTLLGVGAVFPFIKVLSPPFFKGYGFGSALVLCVTGLPWFVAETDFSTAEIKVVSEQESLYGWVRVLDFPEKDIRILTSDASVIGAETHSVGETRLTYQIIADAMPALRPGSRRVLLIGQGAGHIAMALDRLYGIETDTIEIDPAVAEAARTYFGFRPNGKSIVGDARYEVSQLKGPYDLIIHDCFTGGADPTHLLTQEFFQRLKGMLRPDGILAINTVGFYEKGKNPAMASVGKTLDAVFLHRMVFVAMPGEDFNDFVMVGSDRPLQLDLEGIPSGVKDFLQPRIVEVDASKGLLLTDDFNPYADLQLRKSEKYRQLVTEWIGLKLMLR